MPDRLPTNVSDVDEPVPGASVGSTCADWRPLFALSAPREILARLVHDDPLRVRERVARGLRQRAYLLDADRVELRALARVARAAARYEGRPEIGAWIDALVGESIEELVREDLERDVPASVEGAITQLARPLGLEPASMERACVTFNRLALADRRTFFELVLFGRTLEDLCRESGESATDIARRARRALDAILATASTEVAPRVARVAEAEITEEPKAPAAEKTR